ncbi:MAG TPA: 3-hydroxyacyl-CoA dehydrogenase NAD-binding domain-containing protein, partial [Syntrophothermus lipocalidus]|nr:3-hydroxyacyl-CoA dehydrogenase NAD-binding domain-containing protein [Syntrophothermus lipocalidus]
MEGVIKVEVKKIFVVGAGQMGGGITQVAAQAGYEVVQYDITMEL